MGGESICGWGEHRTGLGVFSLLVRSREWPRPSLRIGDPLSKPLPSSQYNIFGLVRLLIDSFGAAPLLVDSCRGGFLPLTGCGGASGMSISVSPACACAGIMVSMSPNLMFAPGDKLPGTRGVGSAGASSNFIPVAIAPWEVVRSPCVCAVAAVVPLWTVEYTAVSCR
jgi:hypothetical protein